MVFNTYCVTGHWVFSTYFIVLFSVYRSVWQTVWTDTLTQQSLFKKNIYKSFNNKLVECDMFFYLLHFMTMKLEP